MAPKAARIDAKSLKARLGPADYETLLAPHLDVLTMQPGGTRGKARCIDRKHKDKCPSLEVRFDPDHKHQPLWCPVCRKGWDVFAALQAIHGCTFPEALRMVAEALGEPPPPRREPRTSKGGRGKRSWTTADALIGAIAKRLGARHTRTWTYNNADGSEDFRCVRFNGPDGSKTFRPIHQAPDGWRESDPPGTLPLFHLPELGDSERAWVLEGEACVEAADSIGLVPATTSAHGSNAANKTDWTPLAGREVVILPDADDAGEVYAREVTKILRELDPPARVKIVKLPDLKDGEDIVEFIAARKGSESEDIRRGIEDLVASTDLIDETEVGSVKPRPVLVRLANVKAEPIKWLWPGRVPQGKLTILSGNPGLGKSFVTLDVAARVSCGEPWPDSPGNENCPGGVVLLSAEDDVADTIRPRLDAAGADVNRIVALQGVRRGRDASETTFCLEQDIPALETAITRVPDCRLVVIDPITAYLGGTDSHRNAELRGLLAPLAELAGRHSVAVLAVSHLNKTAAMAAIYRTIGSIAFVAAARTAWVVVEDEGDAERRLFLPLKSNLAKQMTGLAYSVVDSSIPEIGMVVWESEPVTVSADEALAMATGNPDKQDRDFAAQWLREALADGPMSSTKVFEEARQNGIAEKTLRRAASNLGIKPKKTSFDGGWVWVLPGEAGQDGHEDAHSQARPSSSNGGHLGDDGPEEDGRSTDENGHPSVDRQGGHKDAHAPGVTILGEGGHLGPEGPENGGGSASEDGQLTEDGHALAVATLGDDGHLGERNQEGSGLAGRCPYCDARVRNLRSVNYDPETGWPHTCPALDATRQAAPDPTPCQRMRPDFDKGPLGFDPTEPGPGPSDDEAAAAMWGNEPNV